MGWIKENYPGATNKVIRGIMILSKVDERVEQSIKIIPNLEIRYFDISIN